jgi:hypothetical protein
LHSPTKYICLCLAFYPKLAYGVGLSMCIAAIFDWEPLADRDVLSLKQTVVDDGDDIPPVDIALTLTEHWMPGFEQLSTTLVQEAFRSKTYTIRFEKGNFPVIDGTSSELCGWYSQHLRTDPSPYPPLEQWAMERPAEMNRFWERKDFYRQEIEGGEYYDPKTGVSRREEMELFNAQLLAKLAKNREDRARE